VPLVEWALVTDDEDEEDENLNDEDEEPVPWGSGFMLLELYWGPEAEFWMFSWTAVTCRGECGSPDRAITPFAVTCGQRDHKFQKLGGM
jgi:hypothetical protein